MKRRINVLLLGLLMVTGCALRWRGQEAVAIDPAFDAWLHHPELGSTNRPNW